MKTLAVLVLALGAAPKDDPWVVYEGGDGPGKGKHVVLISGDEEYRSEEALPQLGKILAKHHGFKCTVLFAIDPKDRTINPNISNIPGLEALKELIVVPGLPVLRDRLLAGHGTIVGREISPDLPPWRP